MAITTNLDKVRLEIGDRDFAAPLFYDEELNYFLTDTGDDVLLAAARACDALARRFARDFDFKTDGQEFKKGSISEHYATLAKELRQRAAGGVTSTAVTREDGYSTDIPADQVTAGRGAPAAGRGNFYTNSDHVY